MYKRQHKSNTIRTVELFEKYNGRATFLMLGKNVKQYPEIVKTVYEHGFEIGSHSWDHPDLRKLDANAIEKQIVDTPVSYTHLDVYKRQGSSIKNNRLCVVAFL